MHAFEVHARFGDLRTPSKLARLQLAALYAATSSLLPEPLSCKTGAQMAMQLLRQCWANSPLTPEERLQLDSVGRLGGHLAAGLRLLVQELHLSATQLAHLHAGGGDGADNADVPTMDPDAGTCYCEEALAGSFQGWVANPHMLLSEAEELRAMEGATRSRGAAAPPWFRSDSCRTQDVPLCPLAPAWVEATERDISRRVTVSAAGSSSVPPYPLRRTGALPLEKAMHAELESSWQAWHAAPVHILGQGLEQSGRELFQYWQACMGSDELRAPTI